MSYRIFSSDIQSIVNLRTVLQSRKENLSSIFSTYNDVINDLNSSCSGQYATNLNLTLSNSKNETAQIINTCDQLISNCSMIINNYNQICGGKDLDEDELNNNINYCINRISYFNSLLSNPLLPQSASVFVKHMINNLETQKTTYEQYKSNLLDFINGVNKFYEFTNENYLKPIKYGIKMYNGVLNHSKYKTLKDGLFLDKRGNNNIYLKIDDDVIKANDWLSEYEGNFLLAYKDGGFKVFKNNNRLKQILELNDSINYDITKYLNKNKEGFTTVKRFTNSKDWVKWGVKRFNYSLIDEIKSTFQPKKIIANFKGAKGIIGKTGVALGVVGTVGTVFSNGCEYFGDGECSGTDLRDFTTDTTLDIGVGIGVMAAVSALVPGGPIAVALVGMGANWLLNDVKISGDKSIMDYAKDGVKSALDFVGIKF